MQSLRFESDVDIQLKNIKPYSTNKSSIVTAYQQYIILILNDVESIFE